MTITRLGTIAALLAALTSAAIAQKPPPEMSYRFHYARAGDASVGIEIAWPAPLAEARSLVMPRAIPMGYGEQPYDRFVLDVRAHTADGRSTPAARGEGPRWRLASGTTRVTYRVDVRQMERGVLAASDQSRVRDGYLGVLGYSVFAFVDGYETRPVRVRVEGPALWPVFSTLGPSHPVDWQPLDVRATDFYELADSQIVMGPRAEIRRLSRSPDVFLASYAEGDVDLDRVSSRVLHAFSLVEDYFGSTPFAHYTVHQELLTPISPEHQYGMSMEHLGSSTYYLAASAGLTAKSGPQDDARVLYNFAHHIAHAWLPKRLYGEGYFPFRWDAAPIIDTIWFAEGFAQYAAIVAVSASQDDPAAYRTEMLNRRFRTSLAEAPAELKKLPLVELSRVASTRYSEDFRIGRLVFSRGGLMAAAIDERIQAETKGARSLRDALRFMVAWTERERRAFANDELASLIQQATGVDTRAVIDQWLRPLE